MGQGQGQSRGLDNVRRRAAERIGRVSVVGRYNKLPKRLQDDYGVQTDVLGSGYNGSVYKAIHKLTKKTYAVKSFKLHGVSREKRQDLETECEIFMCMDHPHVARLVDVYESQSTLHLVMECMSGGELFQRVTKRRRFSEKDACDATWQMLLAISYLHSHDVVHRDIKLENWMYDSQDSDHLKLIDFGFSRVWSPDTKMAMCCGTLAYVAPEVLARSYTSQCDLWSLGVTVFAMVFGILPFGGNSEKQTAAIRSGKFSVRKETWNKVSPDVQDFVQALLTVDPTQRLTAQSALEHRWIKSRDMLERSSACVDTEMTEALLSFGAKTQFRRAAMHLMAWSLTNEERAKVREAFVNIDTDRTGTITLNELKQVLEENLHIDDKQAQQAFKALDSTHHDEIFYSEFLAAMLSSHIQMHDHLLHASFKHFDADGSGFITRDELEQALGTETFSADQISAIIADLDTGRDDKIDYEEFVAYFRDGNAKSEHQEAAARFLDGQIKRHGSSQDLVAVAAASEVQIHKMIHDRLPCCGLQ